MDAEQAAAAMYAPQPPASATPSTDPAEAIAAALYAPPAAPAKTAPPEPPETAAEQMYAGSAPTRGIVNWDEPPAQPDEFALVGPVGMVDMGPAGQAAMARLREAFAAAGAGRSLATELFSDVIRAEQGAEFPISRTSAEADLRRAFGPRYDAQVGAARELVARAAQKCPEIIPFLERTGLGNNPDFIRKVAAAAARRR